MSGVICLTAGNAGVMTGRGTNSYVLNDGSVVIDPGPAKAEHIAALKAATQDRLRWVLVTHTHKDHSPAAQQLLAGTGARTVGLPPPDDGNQDLTFVPSRIPQHDELLELDNVRLRAIHTPGHVSNHVCYLDENTGMLFSGDHINQGTTVVIPPPDGCMRSYLGSLTLLKAYPLRSIAPGHGSIIDTPMRAIDSLIRHRLQRETKTLRCLQELAAEGDQVSTDQLLPSVYDDVATALHPVARHSLLAHLIKLEQDGDVVCNGAADEARWAPAAPVL